EAEAVLEPAARTLFAAFRELAPVGVDLVLRLARDLKRERLAERELGSAVQREELLSVELEADGHHGALGPRSGAAVARDLGDPRVGEDRRVELRRVLAFGVEPQAGGDLLHLRRPF